MASGSILAVSYFVDSLGDTDDSLGYTQSDGTNTLRKCIRLANMNAGSDTITFSVSGTINIGSVLPEITDSGTMIDASLRWTGTWPGGSPGVTLDGEKGGLVINGASSCVISGLFIMGSINSGISIIYGAQNNIIGGSAVVQEMLYLEMKMVFLFFQIQKTIR